MKSKKLTNLISEAYRVEAKTVAHYMRLLKEAGLVTAGSKDDRAPHLSEIDAARLTVALLATEKPSAAVEKVKHFATLERIDEKSNSVPWSIMSLPGAETLEGAIAAIFAASSEDFGRNAYSIEVDQNQSAAQICYSSDLGKGVSVFSLSKPTEQQGLYRRQNLSGIRRRHAIVGSEIMMIWAAFYADKTAREGKTPFEGVVNNG